MNNEKLTWAAAVVIGLFLLVPGFVFAADVADSSVGGTIQVDVSEPHIDQYMMIDWADAFAGAYGVFDSVQATDLTRSQVDIGGGGFTYGFWAQCRSDLGETDLVIYDLYLNFDGGADPTGYNALGPGNQNIHVQVDLAGGAAAISLEYPANGEVTLNAASWAQHDSNPGNSGNELEVMIVLDFGEWLMWADANAGVFNAAGDPWDDVGPANWNTDNTWNIEMEITDNVGAGNTDQIFDEYGLFKYSDLAYSNTTITGGGAPGELGVSLVDVAGSNDFKYISNAPHKLTLELDGDLTGSGIPVIPTTEIYADGADFLAATPFPAGATPIYPVGGANDWRLLENMVDGGVSGYLGHKMIQPTLTWYVDIPVGLAEDSYNAAITLAIVTSADPTALGGDTLTPYTP